MKRIKIKLYLACITLATFMITGCTADSHEPLSTDKTPPGVVTNVSVVNQNGQATITYTLPKDQDLLYVKAVYPLQSGATREIKASYYTNSMVLDGFADTLAHVVKLYAVNRAEVPSIPVDVTVKPLENAIWGVFNSTRVISSFGGYTITANNPTMDNVAIEVTKLDSLGRWVSDPNTPTIYTSAKEILSSVRGLDTIPLIIKTTVRDKFLNYTDSKIDTITPIYETLLTKSKYNGIHLDNDCDLDPVMGQNGWGYDQMWNNDYSYANPNRFMSGTSQTGPQSLTIDLGEKGQLSRIMIYTFGELGANWNIGDRMYFYRGCMRFFEIYGYVGTGVSPDQTGAWNSDWLKLGTYQNIKPSGLPYGQQNSDDIAAGQVGFNYDFPVVNTPRIRFIRILNKQNWMGTTWIDIKQISVYGDNR